MLRSIKKTKSFSLAAKDGRIGHMQDAYFDDEHWTIRFVVALAGNWLTGRLVLLSPHAIGTANDVEGTLAVDLTRDQIKDGPSPETNRPVSRQFEMDYYKYFGWPYYWVGPYLWGPSPYPMLPATPMDTELPFEMAAGKAQRGDPHLRSAEEISGYHVKARDGEIGHVEDFLFDERNWSIAYMVMDTRNHWGGKRVLVPPSWIKGIHWEDRIIEVDAEKEELLNAPPYEASQPLNEEDARRLARYYASELHRA